MTNDECRAEALQRIQEADQLFRPGGQWRHVDDATYRKVAHLRQTAAVYAALAAVPPPTQMVMDAVDAKLAQQRMGQ